MTPEELADILIAILKEENDEAFIEASGYGKETVIDGSFDMDRVAAQLLKRLEALSG
jgi:hypothetical protein